MATFPETLKEEYQYIKDVFHDRWSNTYEVEIKKSNRRALLTTFVEPLAKEDQEAFRNEIEEIAGMFPAAEEHVVHLYAWDVKDNKAFFVMEYPESGTLANQPPSVLTLERVVDYVQDLAKLLAYAHQKGVPHRRITPNNIHVKGTLEIALSGFIGNGPILDRLWGQEHTNPYIADKTFNTAISRDIYSLGTIFYEVLTGHLPAFEKKQVPPLSWFVKKNQARKLPQEIELVFARTWAKNPVERFPSFETFAHQLTEALRHAVMITPSNFSRRELFKRTTIAAATAASLVIAYELGRIPIGLKPPKPVDPISSSPSELPLVKSFTHQIANRIIPVAFMMLTPDGKKFMFGDKAGYIYTLDVTKGISDRPLYTDHSGAIVSITSCPVHECMYSIDKEGKLCLWSLEGETLAAITLQGHPHALAVSVVPIAGDKKEIHLLVAIDNKVITFDDPFNSRFSATSQDATYSHGNTDNTVYSLSVIPSAAVGISAGDNGWQIWDLESGRLIFPYATTHDKSPIKALAVSPDGRFIASSGGFSQGSLVFLTPPLEESLSGELIQEYSKALTPVPGNTSNTSITGFVKAISWADNMHFAFGSDDGTVVVSNIVGDILATYQHGAPITSLVWTTQYLFSASEDGVIQIRDIRPLKIAPPTGVNS